MRKLEAETEAKLLTIDTLRRVANYLNCSNKNLNYNIKNVPTLILMCQTIWATGFDLYPEQLTDKELAMAISGDEKGLIKSLEERYS